MLQGGEMRATIRLTLAALGVAVSFGAALEAFLAKHLIPRKGDVKVGEPRVIDMPARK